jgi:hypothetical protein
MLPATLMEVYFGTAMKNIADLINGKLANDPLHVYFFWGGLIITVFVTVYVTLWLRRLLQHELVKYEEVAGGPEYLPGGPDLELTSTPPVGPAAAMASTHTHNLYTGGAILVSPPSPSHANNGSSGNCGSGSGGSSSGGGGGGGSSSSSAGGGGSQCAGGASVGSMGLPVAGVGSSGGGVADSANDAAAPGTVQYYEMVPLSLERETSDETLHHTQR